MKEKDAKSFYVILVTRMKYSFQIFCFNLEHTQGYYTKEKHLFQYSFISIDQNKKNFKRKNEIRMQKVKIYKKKDKKWIKKR